MSMWLYPFSSLCGHIIRRTHIIQRLVKLQRLHVFLVLNLQIQGQFCARLYPFRRPLDSGRQFGLKLNLARLLDFAVNLGVLGRLP